MTSFKESREELISRLDSQYRALIDKYESLLDVYNQTREPSRGPDNVTAGPSIREELGLMEVSMDMLDLVCGGRDVDYSEEITVTQEACPGELKEDENVAECDLRDHYSESSSSGYCENSEPEELDMEERDSQADIVTGETDPQKEIVMEETKAQADIVMEEHGSQTDMEEHGSQTDILMEESPAQTAARHLSRHQTIFAQMFALLSSEPDS